MAKIEQIESLYQNRHTGGVYRVEYVAQSGTRRPGIPHDDMTDLYTLHLVAVPDPAPRPLPSVIVTSEFDLKSNFLEYHPVEFANEPTQAVIPEDAGNI